MMKPTTRQTKRVKYGTLKDVPATYRELCVNAWLPCPIRSKTDHTAATAMLDRLPVLKSE